MKKSNLRDFTCPIKHTFSQEKKKLDKFDHQSRCQGSLRLTGIQIGFENERQARSQQKRENKESNCLSWNLLDINTTTGYISGHKDVFSTSFKTWQSKLSERKPTKRIFMTGSELRCTCYVTVYVWWTQLANKWNRGQRWMEKWLQGSIPGGGGPRIWKGWGCSSEILN